MVNPKPLQKPHPPIYSANSSQEGVEFAAQLGLNTFLPIHTLTRERVKSFADVYWKSLLVHHHDASEKELGLLIPLHVAETVEQAQRQARNGIMDYYRVIAQTRSDYRNWLLKRGVDAAQKFPPAPWEGMTFERVCSQHAVLGDSETVVTKLQDLVRENQATHLLCWMNVGSMAHEVVLQSMERFARDVMPRLRREGQER
jgi:alkanesulfonate monooxygenase SsuD/methylene tetrahydromethanopterin reductase-like flavin-dependent oxidoreductase (luciferase family)